MLLVLILSLMKFIAMSVRLRRCVMYKTDCCPLLGFRVTSLWSVFFSTLSLCVQQGNRMEYLNETLWQCVWVIDVSRSKKCFLLLSFWVTSPWFFLFFSTLFLCITKTCLCNVDPLKPHFHIVKLGFTGVYIIFLFLLKNIDCGYSLEPPRRGGSNGYQQSMFLSRHMKNIRIFVSEDFQFLEVKVSIYLNRRVFVMACRNFKTILNILMILYRNLYEVKTVRRLQKDCSPFLSYFPLIFLFFPHYSYASRKHAYVMLTPLNPTFI